MLKHQGFLLIRRPLRPVQTIYEFNRSVSENTFETALRNFYKKDNLARHAIYQASPTLYDRFTLWLNEAEISESAQLQYTLYKYMIRMCTRCTPFGIFAGCASAEISSHNQLVTAKHPYLHSQLTTQTLAAVQSWILSQPIFRRQIKLKVNSTLYRVGDAYRYIEIESEGKIPHFFLSHVHQDRFTELVFNNLPFEGMNIPDMMSLLQSIGLQASAAEAYLEELIGSGVLVFDIEPSVIGEDSLQCLASRISALANGEDLAGLLKEICLGLLKAEGCPVQFERFRTELSKQGIECPEVLVRTDIYFPDSEFTIKKDHIQTLETQLSDLSVFGAQEEIPFLTDFKKKFKARYGGREMPLASVIDPDLGIGYGSARTHLSTYAPLINNLLDCTMDAQSGEPVKMWWQSQLFKAFEASLENGIQKIEITEQNITELYKLRLKDPSWQANINKGLSMCCIGNLLSESAQTLDKDNFLFNLTGCSGGSGISLLGRFSQGDKQLRTFLESYVKKEQKLNPDVVFAELVHCPHPAVGDILSRSSLYEYEIPYLARSSKPVENQLEPEDLFISMRGDQIMLRSGKLNKRVIPRSTHAHNYQTGLPLYRFLCDLQQEYTFKGIQWSWGDLDQRAFLPRVYYKNIILSRACWLLDPVVFKGLTIADMQNKLNALNVPAQFSFASGDNELLIDTSQPHSLMLLVKQLSKGGKVRLSEILQGPQNGVISSVDGLYANEVVIPFLNEDAYPIDGFPLKGSSITERFLFGSEWLYLKIYGGEKSADRILSETLTPVIRQLLDEGVVDKFFFVRFKDPEPHIRIRFHGDPKSNYFLTVLSRVQQALSSPVINGEVINIEVATYIRELERYGNENIENCESIFHFDSVQTLKFLGESGGSKDEMSRILFAIGRLKLMLTLSGLSCEDQGLLLDFLRENFFKEFNGDSSLRKRLEMQFRGLKSKTMLQDPSDDTHDLQTIGGLLKDVFEELLDRNARFTLLGNLFHMTINRIFSSRQRAYEMFLYHILFKDLISFQKRARPLVGASNSARCPDESAEPSASQAGQTVTFSGCLKEASGASL
jgi:thiopeptide-type bacteriocin biosynthesis protein